MKVLSLAFLIFILNVPILKALELEVWTLGQTYYTFDKIEKNRLYSKGCLDKKEKCDAYTFSKNKIKISLTESEREGGKNPGAIICKKKLGGEILILRDKNENEAAFCKFKDNSLVTASSLY